jgi:hypothetical protein
MNKNTRKERQKWANVTYVGTQTKLITKFLKISDLSNSFMTENTVGNTLKKNKTLILTNLTNVSSIC